MTLFGLALAVFFVGACGALLTATHPRSATCLGAGGAVLGSALGLVPAVQVLLGRDLAPIELPWSVPAGEISLGIDALSAFFLVPIFALGAATAIYGAAYLQPEAGHKQLGMAWLWFDLLLAAMALVATARNGLLFLVAWEGMALSSFFLVVFHHERAGVPRAGWVYLVASHLGTAFLLALFAWLAQASDSLDFAHWSRPPTGTSWLFALALIGFGSKAGFFPFHVWLPEAHPAAPSHASALLSGVMIKLGIYGLLRMVVILGPPPFNVALTLVGVALVSGTFGVLLALGQHDLKRLLAYHSVENIGIIALGLGLGWLAASEHHVEPAALALAGGLLHVWNHALFKSLLFLGAGAVGSGAGTQDLEELGGLLRRMPWTGASFLVGAAAICALPPLNGFVSEFLIYVASFSALGRSATASAAAYGSAIAGLALIGGLAAACFVKASGISFLGSPRSEAAARAREAAPSMRWVMFGLAGACLVLGVAAPLGVSAALRPAQQLLPPALDPTGALIGIRPLLWTLGKCGLAFVLGVLGLVAFRRLAFQRSETLVETWGCGYAAQTPRMQYTASSLAQPLTDLFSLVLRSHVTKALPQGVFPERSALSSHATDIAERAFERMFLAISWCAQHLRWIEAGNTQRYVLYAVLTALALLGWGLLD